MWLCSLGYWIDLGPITDKTSQNTDATHQFKNMQERVFVLPSLPCSSFRMPYKPSVLTEKVMLSLMFLYRIKEVYLDPK